jgi:tripartite-type tricarboxylate transporter receptor subunit TctC
MKRLFGSFGMCAVCVTTALGASAQAFPAKPIRMVVPFAAGGATDTFSRALAAELTNSLGQQVIVENRTGAGTTIGADVVAKAAPDGHTLLFTDLATHTITASLYTKLPYHPLRSFAAVAAANSSPLLLVVHPSVGVKSVKELIALAKRRPGIACGNSGVGTVTHMTAEKFRMREIPAIGETLKGVEGAVISGVLAPAGTPRAIVERLNAEFAKASDAPRVKEIYAVNAAETLKMSPYELQQSLERDVRTWAEVVQATGVKVD